MRLTAPWGLALAGLLGAPAARAGPPFTTDDPEPVEFRHWELYLASQTTHDREGWNGTAPHLEVNYGVIPDVQLHSIAPLAYSISDHGGRAYGPGDVELGVKARFVHEGAWVPQIGTFPLVEVPVGARSRGLGNGTTLVFLPLWLQKRFGAWTTYGGAGLWLDAGVRGRRWWALGWLVQREVCSGWTLGAEIFHETPDGQGARANTRFNAGTIVDLSDTHHLLASAGRSIVGPNRFQGYAAYQVTLGP